MFFLLRVAFWLTIVLVLLPSGNPQPGGKAAQVGATDAVVAAGAAVSDMSGFCDRQPEACEVGAQAAAALGQRAQAGARMVYDFISERMVKDHPSGHATGSVSARKVVTVGAVPAFAGSQSTLKPFDLEPAWQGPPGRVETVPLPRPRKDPRRRA
jgi:hypothetical protein